MKTKNEILDAFQSLGLTRHVKLSASDRERELIITPFQGARSTAGMVFALNGTPPQLLTAMVPNDSARRPKLIDLSPQKKTRTVPPSDKPAYLILAELFEELRYSEETLTL